MEKEYFICSICLENNNLLLNNTIITNCSHIYHKKCMHKYLKYNNICPLCKTYLHQTKKCTANNLKYEFKIYMGHKITIIRNINNGLIISSIPLWINMNKYT